MAAHERPGVMMYFEVRPALEMLNFEQKGELFEAILDYGQYAVVPDFADDQVLAMAFAFARVRLDRDQKRYEEKIRKRVEAGRKGGLASRDAKRVEPEPEPEPEQMLANAAFAKQIEPTASTNANPSANANTNANASATASATVTVTGVQGEKVLKPSEYDPGVADEKRKAAMLQLLEGYGNGG